jgi:predicted aspartyl protease
MIDSYLYDPSFEPAMPVVTVRLRSLYPNSPEIEYLALIDSGSDGTMIPLTVLTQMNARQVSEGIIRGVTGHRQVVALYEVLIQIGSLALGKFQVVALEDGSDLILGRDVLNQLIVTLNGLAQVVEISD